MSVALECSVVWMCWERSAFCDIQVRRTPLGTLLLWSIYPSHAFRLSLQCLATCPKSLSLGLALGEPVAMLLRLKFGMLQNQGAQNPRFQSLATFLDPK